MLKKSKVVFLAVSTFLFMICAIADNWRHITYSQSLFLGKNANVLCIQVSGKKVFAGTDKGLAISDEDAQTSHKHDIF